MKKRKKLVAVSAIVCAVCLAVIIAMLILCGHFASRLSGISVPQHWNSEEDTRYSLVSCFVSPDAQLDENGIRSIRNKIQNKLTESSLASKNENSRLWIDSFSADTKLSFSYNGNQTDTNVFITGDDFFIFHPHDFSSGWGYTGDEVMEDGVVINRALAWKLYGGVDLVGYPIELQGSRCVIVGVTDGPCGKAEFDEFSEEPTAYITYKLAEKLEVNQPIVCYEAILPNPVKSFAMNEVKEAVEDAVGKDNVEFVENTGRYSINNIVKTLFKSGSRVTKTDKIYYPFWENAARKTDGKCSVAALVMLIAAVFPTLCAIAILILLFKNKKKILMFFVGKLSKVFKKIKTILFKKRKREKHNEEKDT